MHLLLARRPAVLLAVVALVGMLPRTAPAQQAAAAAPVELEAVRVLTDDGSSSVLLDLSAPTTFEEELDGGADVVRIRIPGARRGAGADAVVPRDDPRIERISLGTDFVDDALVLEIGHAPGREISVRTLSEPDRIWVLLLDPLEADLQPAGDQQLPTIAGAEQAVATVTEVLQAFGEELELTAEQLLRDPVYDQYIAEGSVRVRYRGMELKADRAIYRATTQEVEGIGHVLLSGPEGTLHASRAIISVKTVTGILFDASFESRDTGLTFAGARILKKGDLDYEIADGTLTSCEPPCPDWSFRGSTVDLTLGDYAHITNARFRVFDVPMLYSPYLILPVKTERETGFLFPEVGYSDKRGFQADIPFFWAISRNVDATITGYLATEERYGVGVETRYIRTGNSRGEFDFEFFREQEPTDVVSENEDGEPEQLEIDRQRYRVRGYHDERITSSLRGKLVLDVLSDNRLDRDTTDNVDLRTRRFTESKALLTQSWQRWTLSGAVRWFEDLENENDNELQDLPEINLRGIRQSIPSTPLVLDLDSTAANFYRREGADGFRWDTLPRLSLPFQLSYFNVTPAVESRTTVYYADVAEQIEEQQLNDDGTIETTTRTVFDTSLEARLIPRGLVDVDTSFSRVFRPGGEDDAVTRYKHRVEPFARFDWIPEVDQDDLPTFDSVDRIEPRTIVSYGLRQTLLSRAGAGGTIAELLKVDLLHSWDLDPRERSDGSAPLCPDGPCPIRGEVTFTPFQGIGVGGLADWDLDENEITNYTLRAGFGTSRGDQIAVRYRFVRDATRGDALPDGSRPFEDLRDLSASLRLRAFQGLWLFASTRYDQQNDVFLENRYGVRARPSDCWFFDVWAIERENDDLDEQDEFEVGVLVTFDGLGSAGKSAWFDERNRYR